MPCRPHICVSLPPGQCDRQCVGCSGYSASNCDACANVLGPDDTCIAACPAGTFATESAGETQKVCHNCHPECADGTPCSGPGAFDCEACRHYSLQGQKNAQGDPVVECVLKCPPSHDTNEETKVRAGSAAPAPLWSLCRLARLFLFLFFFLFDFHLLSCGSPANRRLAVRTFSSFSSFLSLLASSLSLPIPPPSSHPHSSPSFVHP